MDALQKSAKRYAISFTIIYSIIFIPSLFMGLLSGMVFDKPGILSTYGFTIIFLALCVPFSIPFSMYLIWSR